MEGLRDKRVLVAGGATGIGAATAARLAREGAAVVIGDLDNDRARRTAAEVTAAGGRCTAVAFDMGDEASVVALVAAAVDTLGGLDGLFNVAADLSPDTFGRDTDLATMDAGVWRRTFEVNLLGYALTCREALPHLVAAGGGSIVNTSSGAAYNGLPTSPAYAATKAGVHALTRHVATRWGKEGVRCNGVAPGLVMGETQRRQGLESIAEYALMQALSPRLGEPDDLAATVAFLLSDDATWITGQVWSVDGGMTLRD